MTRVLVLGDVMLDVLRRGTVERISPEAPVPVLVNPVDEHRLGGAANTAANAAALGCEVDLVGAVGADESGERVKDLVQAAGIRDHLMVASGCTTSKVRMIAGSHHLLRVDSEGPRDDGAVENGYTAKCAALLPDADVLIIADYDKGVARSSVASGVVSAAVDAGVPVVVDTKSRHPQCFSGATVITPNLREAQNATGLLDPSKAAARLREMLGASVLLTLGADGMLLLTRDGEETIASHAIEVSDVTGAGDTVAAAVAVGLARGMTLRSAAEWASQAAAVAVSHLGTYVVSISDLPGDDGGRSSR